MAEWIANSEQSLSKLIGDIRELWKQHHYLKVNATAGSKRTIPQNAILHTWYTQLALEDRQLDKRGHVRFCKYHYGVPILCVDDPDYRSQCDRILFQLPYESALELMDHWPVTRLMTKAQESQYLQDIQAGYANRVKLEFPQK